MANIEIFSPPQWTEFKYVSIATIVQLFLFTRWYRGEKKLTQPRRAVKNTSWKTHNLHNYTRELNVIIKVAHPFIKILLSIHSLRLCQMCHGSALWRFPALQMCISWLSNQNSILYLKRSSIQPNISSPRLSDNVDASGHRPPAASTCHSLVQMPCLSAVENETWSK